MYIKKALALDNRLEIAKNLLKIEKGEIIYNTKMNQRTPRIRDENFLEQIHWVNLRSQATFELPCCLCGNPQSEMHHINHVRKGKFTEIDPRD
jgi:hypothetical protein